jgi:hypothetical protein
MSIHRQTYDAHAATDGVDPALSAAAHLGEKPKMDEMFKDTSRPKETEDIHTTYNDAAPVYEDEEGGLGKEGAVETNEDLVTRVIHVEDDPTLNPWTFRVFFLGTRRHMAYMLTALRICPNN